MSGIEVWCVGGDRNACKWYEGNKTRPKSNYAGSEGSEDCE